MTLPTTILLLASCCTLAAPVAPTPPKQETAADEEVFKNAKLAHDGAALLDFFRQRTGKDGERDKILALTRQFADDSFLVREKAMKDVLAFGLPAVATLRTVRHTDEEVKALTSDCIRLLERKSPVTLPPAAARLLRHRKPDGALAVLLAYLPFAQDEQAADEVLTTLIALGLRDDKVDAAIAPFLQDKEPARRAAAALLLGRSGTAEQKKAVALLLADTDARVRLRAAQGLIAGKDRTAIPTLLALLGEGPLDAALQAEDLLHSIAGPRAPRVPLSEPAAARKRCAETWNLWWKSNEKIDLTRLETDLAPFNATLRFRQMSRLMVDGLNRCDLLAIRRCTEVPFNWMNGQVFNGQDELDQYLYSIFSNMKAQQQSLAALGFVSLDEYLRTAPQNERDLLAKQRKGDVRVLYVQTLLNDRPTPNNYGFRAILFHLKGERVTAFAIGQGSPGGRP